MANSAFLPPHALPSVRIPPLPCVSPRQAPLLCTNPPPRKARARLSFPGIVSIAGAILTSVVMPWTAPACAAPKELRYDGRQELDSREKAMSLTMTAGAFAALGVWAWKQNRRDDELENVRIKEEVERLEKLKAEFLNVDEDEDSMDDEDLLASLRERIAEDRDGDEEGENEDEKDDEDKGDTVVAEKETDAEEGAAPDSVDMLKRMWEATDEDPKKDSTP